MNDPASFSKHSVSTITEAHYLLSKYKDRFTFKESEDVLEIGCANGVITKEVLYPFVEHHARSVLGVDISQDAVDVASKLHNTEKLSFQRMNIEEENLWVKYEEKFGHIFAFYVLHMLKQPERWSKNISKMLKPTGQFFASVLLPPIPITTIMAAQRADKTAPWYKYIENRPDFLTDYGPNPEETLCDILQSAGFRIDSIESHILTSVHDTEGFRGTLMSLDIFSKYIPEKLRNAYTEDFLRKAHETVQQAEDGRYYVGKNTLSILATKL